MIRREGGEREREREFVYVCMLYREAEEKTGERRRKNNGNRARVELQEGIRNEKVKKVKGGRQRS